MLNTARVVVLVLAAGASGCAQKESAREMKAEVSVVPADRTSPSLAQGWKAGVPAAAPAAPEPAAAEGGGGGAGEVALPRMLTRNGVAVLEVSFLDSAVSAVRAVAAHVGGYIGGENVQSGKNELRQAVFQIMVPAARLDEAIAALKPIGKVESVQIDSQDVGEEFVDVNARLNNQKRLEARLIALLDTRTGKLADVLAVEHELARVREEIDQLTGRSNYLQRQVATSRLQVSVHEPAPITAAAPGTNPVLHAFVQAWVLFVSFLSIAIASLGVLLPLAVLIALVWWASGKLRRRPQAPVPEKTHGLGLQ